MNGVTESEIYISVWLQHILHRNQFWCALYIGFSLSREIRHHFKWMNRVHPTLKSNLHEGNNVDWHCFRNTENIMVGKGSFRCHKKILPLISFSNSYTSFLLLFPCSSLLHHTNLCLPMDPLCVFLLRRKGRQQCEQVLGKNASFFCTQLGSAALIQRWHI